MNKVNNEICKKMCAVIDSAENKPELKPCQNTMCALHGNKGNKCLYWGDDADVGSCCCYTADLAKPSDISCGDGCLAVKGGDLCCGECAKVKIKNLFKYLDSFEYENDVETIARIKNALSTRETP